MQLCERHQVWYWDALIVATAAWSGCSALLSEDLQDGPRFTTAGVGRSLQILSPFNAENRTILTALGLPARYE